MIINYLQSSADFILNNNASLGYRKSNTAYAVGQIAYHSALPTGWYLECTTAGTTGSGDITPTSTIGGTVTDGTVVWEIWAEQAKVNDCYNFTNDCDTCVASGMYAPIVNSNNSPDADFAGRMLVISRNRGEGYTQQIFFSTSPSNEIYSRIRRSGVWTPWKQQEAIIAKSLGRNGYIEYASGLILQWGGETVVNGSKTIPYPISFTSSKTAVMVQRNNAERDFTLYSVTDETLSYFIVTASNTGDRVINWFAIGY